MSADASLEMQSKEDAVNDAMIFSPSASLQRRLRDPEFVRVLQCEARSSTVGIFADANEHMRRLVVDLTAHIAEQNRHFARTTSALRTSVAASPPEKSCQPRAAFVPRASLTHSVVAAAPVIASPSGVPYRSGGVAHARAAKANTACSTEAVSLKKHRVQCVEQVRQMLRSLESCAHILLNDVCPNWTLPVMDKFFDKDDARMIDWSLDRQRDALCDVRSTVLDALQKLERFAAESFMQSEKRVMGGNVARLQSEKARREQYQYVNHDALQRPANLDANYSLKRSEPSPVMVFDPVQGRPVSAPVPARQPSAAPSDAASTQRASPFERERRSEAAAVVVLASATEPALPAARAQQVASAEEQAPSSRTTQTVSAFGDDTMTGASSQERSFALEEEPVAHVHYHDNANAAAIAIPSPPETAGAEAAAPAAEPTMTALPTARPLDFESAAGGGSGGAAVGAAGGADPPRSANPRVVQLASAEVPRDAPLSNAGTRKVVVRPASTVLRPARSPSGGADPQMHGDPIAAGATTAPNGPSQPPPVEPTPLESRAAAAGRSPIATVAPGPAGSPQTGGRAVDESGTRHAMPALSPAQIAARRLAQRRSDSDSEEAADAA